MKYLEIRFYLVNKCPLHDFSMSFYFCFLVPTFRLMINNAILVELAKGCPKIELLNLGDNNHNLRTYDDEGRVYNIF